MTTAFAWRTENLAAKQAIAAEATGLVEDGDTIEIDPTGENRIFEFDTGDGIRPDDLPHVFDRGFRSTSTSRACPASSGLGLAIVRRILALHDSDVTVHSAPGKGTEFRFVLPHATGSVAEPLAAQRQTADAGPAAVRRRSDAGSPTPT